MFLKIIIPFSFALLGILIYNVSKKSISEILDYLKECKIYLSRLKENKTFFIKRIEDKSHIEYGIEKIFIFNTKEKIFRFLDKNNETKMISKNKKFLFIINKIIMNKTIKKHKDSINDFMYYKESLLDKRTYNLMNFMIDMTIDNLKLLKKNKEDVVNLEETMDFNIDDILDKINKIGYPNLTDKEKEFLNNHN
jgi:hypothetical protein|tara:strand:- start:1487 stop:2068 length:582 start_codon:yes stop_codon:yes gene_type:complete